MDISESAIVALVYIFTILIPINGALVLGMINERKKMRKILMGMWKIVK